MTRTGKRGFGSMDPDVQRKHASAGGKACHAAGTGHEWNVEQARAAGRKGSESRARKQAELDAALKGTHGQKETGTEGKDAARSETTGEPGAPQN